MIGHRLAEACGRLDDVDGFLDSMPSERMERLIAYDNVHGIGNDRLMEIMVRGFMLLAGMWQGENSEPIDPAVIDPWRKDTGQQAGGMAVAKAQLESISGVSRG